tara:strand:+ start:42 stop:506 length:465 start_codon:yes stop_codon:yes gene_type:complete
MPFFGLKQTKGEFNRLKDGTSPLVTDMGSAAVTPAAMRSKMMSQVAEFQEERNPAMTSPQPVSALMSPPSPDSAPAISPAGGPPSAPTEDGGSLQPALVDMSAKKGGPLQPSDFPAEAFGVLGSDPGLDQYLAQNLIDEMTYHASVSASKGPAQ